MVFRMTMIGMRYTVPEGASSLVVRCNFLHLEGDIDMSVITPSDDTITSGSISDEELITILPAPGEDEIEPGVYKIRVYGWIFARLNAYDLIVSSELAPPPPPPSPEDNYEVNNQPAQAYNITGLRGSSLSADNGLGTCLDPDWYSFTVTGDETLVTINLAYTHYVAANLVLELRARNGSPIYASSDVATEDTGETITYRLPGAGTYMILVHGDYIYGAQYDLSWDATAPVPDDIYENNDTLAAATSIQSSRGGQFSPKAIQYDYDWYTFTTAPGESLVSLVITPDNPDAELEARFYYNKANQFEQFFDQDDDGDISTLFYAPTAAAAEYHVLVTGDGSGESYTIAWNAFESPGLNENDAYEHNDYGAIAYDLSSHSGVPLSSIHGVGALVPNDTDWYQFRLPAGHDQLRIVDVGEDWFILQFFSWLYDSSGNQLDVVWIDDELVVTGAPGALYKLEILGTSEDFRYEYDFYWTSSSSTPPTDGDLLDDDWERAHSADGAASIDPMGNPDADRYPNWAEYTLDLDPNVFSSKVVRQFENGDYIYMQFTQRKSAIEAGYTISVQESSSLSFSGAEAVHVATVDSPDDPEVELVTYRCSQTLDVAPQCFFMLEVNQPE